MSGPGHEADPEDLQDRQHPAPDGHRQIERRKLKRRASKRASCQAIGWSLTRTKWSLRLKRVRRRNLRTTRSTTLNTSQASSAGNHHDHAQAQPLVKTQAENRKLEPAGDMASNQNTEAGECDRVLRGLPDRADDEAGRRSRAARNIGSI